MAITALHVGNFKGIAEDESIKIKPITLFIGPNSSGKSSCIHALASLSQTMKLPNDFRPLSLDGEFAYVHLGRFIEVIHSKSYSEASTLGLETKSVTYSKFEGSRRAGRGTGDVKAVYTFRCTRRTQDIYLDKANVNIGPHSYTAKKANEYYEVTNVSTNVKMTFDLKAGFLFDQVMSIMPENVDDYLSFLPLFEAQRAIQNELQNTLYLGPFRQSPLRRYPTRGSNPTEVGAQGEATTTLLANEAVQSRRRSHIKQIANWLNLLGLAKRLDISRIARSDLFDGNITLKDGDAFPIADLGYGLSQVLPVLAQCSFAQQGATLLFEQPELHLHSLAAKPLGSVDISA